NQVTSTYPSPLICPHIIYPQIIQITHRIVSIMSGTAKHIQLLCLMIDPGGGVPIPAASRLVGGTCNAFGTIITGSIYGSSTAVHPSPTVGSSFIFPQIISTDPVL